MNHKFSNLVILLENPKYAGNIGMICRLIANFDLPPLRIVGKKPEFHFEMDWMAYNAKEELDKIEFFSTLKEAVSDLDYLIGTGMMHGKDRGAFKELHEVSTDIQAKLTNNVKLGIGFGREDRGLSNEFIDKCIYVIDFMLPGKQPSMNLSNSVAYVLGSLYNLPLEKKEITYTFKDEKRKAKFYEYAGEIFKLLGMNEFHGRENLPLKRFQKILDKRDIPGEDWNFLFKILQSIEAGIKNGQNK